MSRYLVRIVMAGGAPQYLSQGITHIHERNGTRYPSPSAAREAINGYLLKHPGLSNWRAHISIVDTRDPDREVEWKA